MAAFEGFGDFVSQAMNNTADVLKSRYGARMGVAGNMQDASLGSVDQPSDVQARAGSYINQGAGFMGTGMGTGVVVAAAAAVVLLLVVVMRK